MLTKGQWGVWRRGRPRLYLGLGLLSIVALIPAVFRYAHGQVERPGAGTGAVADNGANLTTRIMTWLSDAYSSGSSFCGLSC